MHDSEKLFGDLLVEQGLTKPEQVRECLALQEELRSRNVTPIPKLGELLLQKGYLSPQAYQETVGLRMGDEKFAEVEIADSEKVNLPVSVMEAMKNEENRFGKYLRVSPLGSGGMGEVWKAWDTDLGRWVALKFLKSLDAENLVRFQREAQTAGQVDHPHIATIYEVGEKSGTPYIAMQYVDGQTLSTFPRDDIREIVRLMQNTAMAVHAAHEKGIIHRDIKPANIMVGQKESMHVYVMDFGLAKEISVDTSISQSGLVLGTPTYMSPEQARGRIGEMDSRSDIYSLGATLYELLTGRPPFLDDEILKLLRKVVEVEPVPIRKRNPHLPRDLETIVMKCLRKEPEKRYPTAAALAEELGKYLEGESISARPIGRTEKVSRWVNRNRALSATIAVLVLVMIGGGLFFHLDSGRKERARRNRLQVDVTSVLDRVRSGIHLESEEDWNLEQARILEYRDPRTVHILVEELDALSVVLKRQQSLDRGKGLYLGFLCQSLARMNLREGAVAALGRYLEVEGGLPEEKRAQLRPVPAAKALCLLGGEEADRLLQGAKEKFGPTSIFWGQVLPLYQSTGSKK